MLGTAYQPLTEKDHNALGRLWWESWQSTGLKVAQQTTEDALRRRVDQELVDGWDVTLAVRNRLLVGFLAIKPQHAVLDQLFVAPEAKGQGIGRDLLALAKAKMAGGFTLRTAVDNEAACRFYKRAGLTRSGTAVHPTLGHSIAIFRWDTLPPQPYASNSVAPPDFP